MVLLSLFSLGFPSFLSPKSLCRKFPLSQVSFPFILLNIGSITWHNIDLDPSTMAPSFYQNFRTKAVALSHSARSVSCIFWSLFLCPITHSYHHISWICLQLQIAHKTQQKLQNCSNTNKLSSLNHSISWYKTNLSIIECQLPTSSSLMVTIHWAQ